MKLRPCDMAIQTVAIGWFSDISSDDFRLQTEYDWVENRNLIWNMLDWVLWSHNSWKEMLIRLVGIRLMLDMIQLEEIRF